MAGKTDASIVFSVTDNLSQSIVGMRNSLTPLRKDVTSLQQELNTLDATRIQLKNVDMRKVRDELSRTRKAMEDLGDSATEAERTAAKADFDEAVRNYANVERQLSLVGKQARETEKDILNLTDGISRADNRAGLSGGSGSGVLSALGKAGLGKMAGDAALEITNTLIGSAFGDAAGSVVSSGLSGAISGAAMGSLAGPVGTAVGAALGGAIGLLQGGTQAFQGQDEAFKSYYQQLNEAQGSKAGESLTAGSATAAQRELDAIAFGRLLGGDAGDRYLADLREMAAKTPMEYGDLTGMSRALATGFGDSPERMLKLMEAIGDAGSAVGMDASGMTEMARAMSRMNSSGKASLEYLNIFQDRGVDVIGMLGEALGKTQGEIYGMISKSQIKGQDAASIIQAGMEEKYGGAMAVMAETFSGLTSTLQDTMTEIHNARGEGYNETRASGIQSEIDAYGGILGSAVENVNRIAGENEAYLENLQEKYTRDALSAVLLGQTPSSLFDEDTKAKLKEMQAEFMSASGEYESTGSREAGLKMDSLRQQAEALATAAYESSEQYRLVHQVELDQIDAIRENTSALQAWKNDYEIQQEYSKGLAAGLQKTLDGLGGSLGRSSGAWQDNQGNYRDPYTGAVVGKANSHAYGLGRVPYDGYAALLHEGERVLTAREARTADAGGNGDVHITIPVERLEVRRDSDVDAVARALYQNIQLARRGGVRS